MFATFKLGRLAGAIRDRRNLQDALAAVVDLGRIGSSKAVDLLIESFSRGDAVTRAAARELARINEERAIKPLTDLLGENAVSQSAAEALIRFGSKAVPALAAALSSPIEDVRRIAADVLAQIRDSRAVDPLIAVMQNDNSYAVRTAAAKALGELKDPRALWVIVGTLKLRDETTPERQAALEELRAAASNAWRKIGDPLGKTDPSEFELPPESETHPKLAGDIADLSDGDLIAILKELVVASEEVSWAKLESREPMLVAYLKSYDQRRELAEMAGAELLKRGGPGALASALAGDLNNHSAIRNWWTAKGLVA